MTRNEILLGVAALVLVGFSLVVALVVPRRNPDFPGDRLGLFSVAALLLVAGIIATFRRSMASRQDRDKLGELVLPSGSG